MQHRHLILSPRVAPLSSSPPGSGNRHRLPFQSVLAPLPPFPATQPPFPWHVCLAISLTVSLVLSCVDGAAGKRRHAWSTGATRMLSWRRGV
ncbi:hypothetical protein SETIT_5G326300v2 [Setaria italica]|uniref:Uncharacterized protein n=2 Tax=Setaria TaxID=4554 RepID=A0A368RBA0_SETIT|nr:hypothetical protein SETIT_5G326300v2 [Setaria italica]TKW16905.1 hypothetical protein SEVIR_5G330000v2 [Setaria viridis]